MIAAQTAQAEAIRRAVADLPGLQLLLVFGSRARGDSHQGSHWDFAYLGSSELDGWTLRARVVEALDDDHVDLVDLDGASGLLRYRAARDGLVVIEAAPSNVTCGASRTACPHRSTTSGDD
jgi:predicted nucleotidyltransferase